MSTRTIPGTTATLFTADGVVPPYVGGDPTEPANQAPYPVTMKELAECFAINQHRRNLLRGLLNYRKELSSLGVDGFQWICGSYIEDTPRTKNRPPGDIDLINIIISEFPVHNDVKNLGRWNGVRGTPIDPKARFNCDAYNIYMLKPDQSQDAGYVVRKQIGMVESIKYWYALFSHQKSTDLWKGMFEVSLDLKAAEDDEALKFINQARQP